MTDSSSSAVSIVAIIAILVLVGVVAYFLIGRGGDDGLDIDVDLDGVSVDVREVAPPTPAMEWVTFV